MDAVGHLATPLIECREVTKTYRSIWAGRSQAVCALRDVSLEIGSGTIVGLIGPNGAGKTTFLSLIAGLIHPSGGWVRVGGYPARSIEARRLLAYVPESPVFLARYSARAVLRFHAALHGLSRRDIGDVTERLLEHSSPRLTNEVYTNVDPVLRQAINQLPVREWL